MRALAIMYAEDHYRAWGDFLYSVQTGATAFEKQFGASYYDYLAQHPEASQVFNEAMTGWTMQLVDAVVEAYDFSPFKTIVDVGGSHGTLLAAVLQSNPGARGVLFDVPHVVADAEEQGALDAVAERCTAVGGDFFVEVPKGGDAYILAQILHGWDDEGCVAILQQCRRRNARAREAVGDRACAAGRGGARHGQVARPPHACTVRRTRKRTAAEYAALFRAAGFELARVVPTAAGASVVEAVLS